MALTKLPKNAIADDAIDTSKIEDGTIQNQEISGTLPETKLATGTIENAKLSNSSITINGTSISLGGSSSVGVDVNWQSVQTTGFTAVAGNGYFVDTTSGAITVTLPASATLGDQIAIKDYAGTFASNNLTIGRNGHNIQGVANDSLISTNRASLLLVYVDSTKGWIYAEESNVGDLGKALFTAATGGTITTSGDFKIHTFTGDGCFVVSTTGNSSTNPSGGPAIVDYLVVAGGGGGGSAFDSGSGGGGAGGFRESKSGETGCWSASPLVTPTGLTITNTTYPITVGGGGNAPCNGAGTSGSNSIFSTITSTGGGGGDRFGGSGGSGGGGGGRSGTPGGSGNTPPVSPPQGQPGGSATPSGSPPTVDSAGGGGGAGGSGGNGSANSTGGAGGNGVTTSFTGSPVTRAGGGGGGSEQGSGGSGGSGGGGPGGYPGVSGTANTGGGGGGFGNTGVPQGGVVAPGGLGGKGIVIIRYKYQ